MTDKPLLTIELVPKTSWYANLRSNVNKEEWDIIRKKCYTNANHKCEICGDTGKNQGFKHNVECHEIWKYDNKSKNQILIGLISLCPYCHKTKHVGLAQLNGEEEIVIKQLMKINNMTRDIAKEYIKKSFEIWEKRSKFDWNLNIDYLEKYCKSGKNKLMGNIEVVNKYKHQPTENDVYIGRGSPLGNPYTSKDLKNTIAQYQCSSREESVEKYESYLKEKIEQKNKLICDELNRIYKLVKDGNSVNFICYCAPKLCHGEIIKKFIEEKLK